MSSSLIIAYLFLGGAGAGMLFVLSVASFLPPRKDLDSDGSDRLRPLGPYARLFGLGCCTAAVVCTVAALCLVFDMERPDAILGLILKPNASVVSVGAYALGLSIVLGAVLSIFWLTRLAPRMALFRAVSALAGASALVVMAYTGLLLGIIPHAVFWQSPLVAVLFAVSSLSCGIALVLLAMMAFRLLGLFRNVVSGLLFADAMLIALEAIVLVAFVVGSAQTAPQAIDALLTGSLATLFWVGLVAVGLVAPLAAEIALRARPALAVHPCVAAIAVLLGGLCLRICIVFAA